MAVNRKELATAPSQDMSSEFPATARLGGCRLVREIGQGGMGTVYEAIQESLHRKVAVKVLPVELVSNARFLERFQREADALAQLKHPNIVSVIDRGVEGKTYYFVMEFVEGKNGGPAQSLRQHISRRRDRKSTRLNSSHIQKSRMPSSA